LPANEASRARHAHLRLQNHFRHIETQLALAVLLRRFDFSRLADDEPEPSATLRPKHGVRIRVTARA
jgi:cytochrome P450